jgi:hypothetical protein
MRRRIAFWLGIALLSLGCGCSQEILHPKDYKHWVDDLNASDPEDVNGGISNAQTWDWMQKNISFFACPDPNVEQIYYYRWWAYRKHIEKTPQGYVITEFLRPVKHATQYNAISCALGLHIAEGRWLHDPEYINDYVNFWLRSGDNGGLQKAYHHYSGWTADALYSRWLVIQDTSWLTEQLDALIADYKLWEYDRLSDNQLFWQHDVEDGMEESISGGRKVKNQRPTLNSYMYANARAIAAIAALAGRPDIQRLYQQKADALRVLVQSRLWNSDQQFFEVVKPDGTSSNVREELGYTPWYFNLPREGHGYEIAWKQLMDSQGFYAPFGPTTAEQRNPGFKISDKGHDCQWCGPTWPFSTSVTLVALANVLNNYAQAEVTRQDYWDTFMIYTHSQHRTTDAGAVIPWVDEDQNPFTGEWWTRTLKIQRKTFYGRGDHYNHSTYADVVITGVVGLRPRADSMIEVNPLVPEGTWDWFALDRVLYHGHNLAIVWDKNGEHFHRGIGLRVYCDGKLVGQSDILARIVCPMK